MNDPTLSIVKIWSGIDWPVQNSVSKPTTRKNMAVRPLIISASSLKPVMRLASQDRNSLRRSRTDNHDD